MAQSVRLLHANGDQRRSNSEKGGSVGETLFAVAVVLCRFAKVIFFFFLFVYLVRVVVNTVVLFYGTYR